MPYHDRLAKFAKEQALPFAPLCDLVDEIVREQLDLVCNNYIARLRENIESVVAMTSRNFVPTTRQQLASALGKIMVANPLVTREELAAKLDWSVEKMNMYFGEGNAATLPDATGESSGGSERPD